jgi:16S rRNA (guanine966-N2)-methyltransferase
MRIIAGAWKGRSLRAPEGGLTRPTADRVRQSMFDMLLHAPWGGRAVLEGARVLDAFAGTGALGLEALSRGAAEAVFLEQDRAALSCLRANVAACGAGARATVLARDALRPGKGTGKSLIFLDPPYGRGLVQRSLNILRAEGWLLPGCLVVAEISALDPVVEGGLILADRVHGAAHILVLRDFP